MVLCVRYGLTELSDVGTSPTVFSSIPCTEDLELQKRGNRAEGFVCIHFSEVLIVEVIQLAASRSLCDFCDDR